MKKTTFKFLLPVLMLMLGNLAKSQTCTASFVYSTTPNGGVNFFSTSIPQNTINTQFYWNFGNSSTFTATGNPNASTTYTANGTYTVSLFFLAPMTCSNMISAVVTITNVSTGTCNLNANFSWSLLSNGNVQFNNTSTGTAGGTTYLWNFGNNNTSTSTSPMHQYSSNGTYTVTLLANNNFSSTCVDSVTMVINVTNICQLNAGFTYSVNGGAVNFYNTTTPTISTTYSWTFGNNSTSSQVNPSTTYTANGTYTVTLFAHSNSPNCNSASSQTILITNSSTCNINANFNYSQGSNGLVNFNNTSTGTNGGTTYSWNFGDSNTSTSGSPGHTYASNGSYVVTLTASNGGTCTSVKTLTVNVNSICNLNASFNYTLNSNGQVSFASTSTGTLSNFVYLWNFGDQTSGLGSTANHTYANGTYVVVLTVANSSISPTCTSVATQTISVTSNTCVANAAFSVVPTSTAQYWNAFPVSGSNVVSAQWSWGDGNFSNTLYTSHQYSAAGSYDLCLSVTVACGATDTYCALYNIFRLSGSSDIIYVNVLDPSTVGLDEMMGESAVNVYPNPTTGFFTVQLPQKAAAGTTASLYNITGARIQSNNVAEDARQLSLDGSSLPTGIYFLKIETQNKRTIVQKIVVDR